MGDHQYNAAEPSQIIFQPCDHLIVQMVRRLIQQKEIRRGFQNLCQRNFFLLAAGQVGNRRIIRKNSQTCQIALHHPAVFRFRILNIRLDRRPLGKFRILRKIGDSQSVLADHLAFVRLFQTCDHPQKRRLSGTVNPDNSDLLPFLNAERCIVKNRFFSVNFAHMFNVQYIHSGNSFIVPAADGPIPGGRRTAAVSFYISLFFAFRGASFFQKAASFQKESPRSSFSSWAISAPSITASASVTVSTGDRLV